MLSAHCGHLSFPLLVSNSNTTPTPWGVGSCRTRGVTLCKVGERWIFQPIFIYWGQWQNFKRVPWSSQWSRWIKGLTQWQVDCVQLLYLIILNKSHSKICSLIHTSPRFNTKNQIHCIVWKQHGQAIRKLKSSSSISGFLASHMVFEEPHTQLQAAGPQIPAPVQLHSHLFLWMAAVSWWEHTQVNTALGGDTEIRITKEDP